MGGVTAFAGATLGEAEENVADAIKDRANAPVNPPVKSFDL